MAHVINKKEVIKSEIDKFIFELPLQLDKKSLIMQKVEVDDIFNSFLKGSIINNVKPLNFRESKLETLDDYVSFVTKVVSTNIMTAMIKCAIEIRLIEKNMTLEEQLNLLIDLKNLNDTEALQAMIADTLESKI